jgi:hypothetical protein
MLYPSHEISERVIASPRRKTFMCEAMPNTIKIIDSIKVCGSGSRHLDSMFDITCPADPSDR